MKKSERTFEDHFKRFFAAVALGAALLGAAEVVLDNIGGLNGFVTGVEDALTPDFGNVWDPSASPVD